MNEKPINGADMCAESPILKAAPSQDQPKPGPMPMKVNRWFRVGINGGTLEYVSADGRWLGSIGFELVGSNDVLKFMAQDFLQFAHDPSVQGLALGVLNQAIKAVGQQPPA